MSIREEADPVRRRLFLVAAGLAPVVWPGAAAAAETGPAELLAERFSAVLFGRVEAQPLNGQALRAALFTAEQDFASCRYVDLADRLPAAIAAAEVSARNHPEVSAVLARLYDLATRALGKLDVSGLQWLTADRGMHAARAADDPLLVAAAQRQVSVVARRAGHREQARALTLAAADHLTLSRPQHLAAYGMLLCAAGYAAADSGDREGAYDLLNDADATAKRLPDNRELVANVVSYRVSAANALGDAGNALAHAQALPLAAVPTIERRARLMVDVAASYAQWDKPDRAYATLLAAERIAPAEIRTRSAVRRLVGELMRVPNQAGMRGLPALAGRVRV